jgi:tape measure domain-containing protein
MSSVDNRIVKMEFDNAQFEAGIRQTLSSLAALEKGLRLPGAGAGLTNINAAVRKVDLSPISAQTAEVESRFSIMAGAASVALGNIASRAAVVGGQVAKSLTFGPIGEGFSDYELKIKATQTIMAGTGESIEFVTKQLKELDIYADETIYSLGDMLNNIGKFTNAGVPLEQAVGAMKGIANVAAVSGASTNEAARAMYNLGQAIGSGVVRAKDWISVDIANMGTKEFKQQLIDAAVASGELTKGLRPTSSPRLLVTTPTRPVKSVRRRTRPPRTSRRLA